MIFVNLNVQKWDANCRVVYHRVKQPSTRFPRRANEQSICYDESGAKNKVNFRRLGWSSRMARSEMYKERKNSSPHL